MISEQLQQRIRQGDRAAFHELYGAYSRTVYVKVLSAVGHADRTREITRQIFLDIYREICAAKAPIEVERRIAVLAGTYIQGERNAVRRPAPPKEAPPAVTPKKVPDAASGSAPYQPKHAPAKASTSVPSQKQRPTPPAPTAPHPRHGNPVGKLLSALICLLCLVFLWIAVGLLMEFGVFPAVDLGYTWFNSAVFRLFYSF